MVSAPESTERTPPLMSFATLITALDTLKANGLPKKIDRSVFKSLAFNVQAQVVTTLKFFDLIDGEGLVQPALEGLVTDVNGRSGAFKALLETRYPKLVELGAGGATEQQLIDAVRAMGLKGEDPIRKAIAFYRKAAEFAELPISSYWQTKQGRPKGAASGTAKRAKKTKATRPRENEQTTSKKIERPPIQIPIHPMLQGAIQFMWEKGETWSTADKDLWCQNFTNMVSMVYPGSKHRPPSTEGKRGANGRKAAGSAADTREDDANE